VVQEAASFSNSTKKINPKWTVMTSILVSIYRDEVAKVKAIDNHNLMASANSGTGPDVEDGVE
jgi:hypothetical protein